MKNLATRENIMLCVVAVLALCAFNLNGRVGKLENRGEDARQKRMKKDAVR